MATSSPTAADALDSIIRILSELDEDARMRVLTAVNSFFKLDIDVGLHHQLHPAAGASRSGRPTFSADNAPTPKDFLLEKQPRTDVERVACLAYYLTHFRDLPHFKTLDLAKLNTEAAQPKFSNAAYSATNAAKMGYLAPALKGTRQLSAAGEQFVRALPDRDAAKAAMARARPRKLKNRKK